MTVERIGLNSRCFFRDSKTLIIRLEQGATILPGDTITIPAGRVPLAGNNAYLGRRVVNLRDISGTVSQNMNPTGPVIQIIGTHYTSTGNFIQFDGSASYGGAGRPFIGGYRWSLQGPTNNLNLLLAAYISTQNGPILSISSEFLLATQTYTISLTLTNWVGLTSTDSITFYVDRQIREQIFSNVSSKIYTHADNFLSFRVYSQNPQLCNGNPNISPLCAQGPNSFAWRRTSGAVIASRVDTTTLATSLTNTFTTPPFTLVGGRNYSISVTSISNSNPTTAFLVDPLLQNGPKGVGRDRFDVIVALDPLIAVISGGNARTQSYTQTLQLYGGDSYDPNGTPSNSITYRWSCVKIGNSTLPYGGCYANDYFALPQYQTAYVELSQFVLEPGVYTFYLDVAKNDSFGNPITASRTSANVTLYWGQSPSANIDVYDTDANTKNYYRPIPSHRLVLSGTSRPSNNAYVSNYTWVLVEGDFTLETSTGYNVNEADLIIPSGTLTPGATYTFGLYVLDSNSNSTFGGTGYAQITFTTDDAPHGGNCSITPTSGNQYTEFNISCTNFQDNLADYPLFYRFFIPSPDGSNIFPLSSGFVPSGVLTSLFPTSYSGPIQVYYEVTDRLGATDPFPYSVGVINVTFDPNAQPIFASESSADILQTVYNNNIPVVNSGRVENIAQLVYSILADLNIDNNSNNSVVNATYENPLGDGVDVTTEEALRLNLLRTAQTRLALEDSQIAGLQLLNIVNQVVGGDNVQTRTVVAKRLAAETAQAARNKRFTLEEAQNLGIASTTYNTTLQYYASQFLIDIIGSGRATSFNNVQLAVNTLSNLLQFSQAYFTTGSDGAAAVSSNIVTAINLILAQQSSNAVQNAPDLIWVSNNIVLAVRRNSLTCLPLDFTYGRVAVRFPQQLTSLLNTNSVTSAFAIVGYNPYSWKAYYPTGSDPGYPIGPAFSTNVAPEYGLSSRNLAAAPDTNNGQIPFNSPGSEAILGTAFVKAQLYDSATGAPIIYNSLSNPVVYLIPSNPNGVGNRTPQDIIGTYGEQCQSWNSSINDWYTGQCYATVNNTNGDTICECYEVTGAIYTTALPSSVVPAGPIITGAVPLGAFSSSSSSDFNRWWFLVLAAIILCCALCVLMLIALFTAIGKDRVEEGEEDYEIVETTTTVAVPEKEITPTGSPRPRMIEVPMDDDLESIALLRPVAQNGIIQYTESEVTEESSVEEPLTDEEED